MAVEHISRGLLRNLNEFLALLEARQLNRCGIKAALDRGGYKEWPEIEGDMRERTSGMNGIRETTEIPPGIRPAAEALGRLKRLQALDCPMEDLEGAIGFFIAITRIPYSDVSEFIFGKGEALNVRA
ncbi:MAG: hypothetical protein SWK76_00220 [Actinomycetota bacterium]|nr:hypothetical protein [Actinomycetota bacterium]